MTLITEPFDNLYPNVQISYTHGEKFYKVADVILFMQDSGKLIFNIKEPRNSGACAKISCVHQGERISFIYSPPTLGGHDDDLEALKTALSGRNLIFEIN